MKTYKVGLIRVLTTEDEELLQLHGKLIESYFPMFQVVSRCIPDQPEGIHDDETFAVGGESCSGTVEGRLSGYYYQLCR